MREGEGGDGWWGGGGGRGGGMDCGGGGKLGGEGVAKINLEINKPIHST